MNGLAAAIVMGCGPEVTDDADAPPGVLEYEHPASAFYRLERRVEIVPLDPVLSRHQCGYMSERAYDDIVTTIDALDPSVDYNLWTGCLQTSDPQGHVHLEGFEHSPFVCDWDCCHPELIRVALVYFLVENAFVGQDFILDDDEEPYVALEAGRSCE